MTIHHDKLAYGKLASMREDIGEDGLSEMLGALNGEEFLDVVDENGVPTGETVGRAEAHAAGVRHRTAHVWLFRKKGGEVFLLLQKRAARKDYPGCYDISAAGHLAAGEGPLECALRETEEELGVRAEEKDLIYCGRRVFCYRGEKDGRPFIDDQVSEVYLLSCDREEADFSVDPEEAECVRWFSFGAVEEGVKNNSFRHCIYADELEMLRRQLF